MALFGGDQGSLFRREIFSPTTLAQRVQDSFDRDFGHLWLEGEIAELSLPRSGHAYFTLKDSQARLKAVMWKGRRAYAGTALSEGLTVLAKGRLAVYAPRGDYQLVVDYLEPKGEGALRQAFEELKTKLTAEGLFDSQRKRTLPFWPRKIAVISSQTGAAARDFIETARQRRPGAAISLYPVRVQGEGAASEIVSALADLNSWGGFDLIVLTRGGGSLSDLWAFNEESVVRAVAGSRTVTLAAIGHSTDLSLTEMAADFKAITPTAAAEAVFRDQASLEEFLAENQSRMIGALEVRLAEKTERLAALLNRQKWSLSALCQNRKQFLEHLTMRLGRMEDRLGHSGQRLDDLLQRLSQAALRLVDYRERQLNTVSSSLKYISPFFLIKEKRQQLDNLRQRLDSAVSRRLELQNHYLEKMICRLNDLSPESVLKRGYALVTGPDGQVVLRASELKTGDTLRLKLMEGGLRAEVKDIL